MEPTSVPEPGCAAVKECENHVVHLLLLAEPDQQLLRQLCVKESLLVLELEADIATATAFRAVCDRCGDRLADALDVIANEVQTGILYKANFISN